MSTKYARGFRLRWRKNAQQSGIYVGPRGSTLFDANGIRFATVMSLHRSKTGWFWVAGWESDVPRMNTFDKPVATETEAKAAALAYVRTAIAKETGEQP